MSFQRNTAVGKNALFAAQCPIYSGYVLAVMARLSQAWPAQKVPVLLEYPGELHSCMRAEGKVCQCVRQQAGAHQKRWEVSVSDT